MALYHFSAKVLSRSSRNTVGALAYRAGCKLYDEKTGLSFNYESKPVEHVELLLPKDAPAWAVEIQHLMERDRQKGVQAFCDRVEAAEKRIDAQVWREFEFALHRELTKEQNIALAREFIQDQICTLGMVAQLNFHFDVDKETGDEKPHCHAVITLRSLDEEGLSPKKERDWNQKELLSNMRIQWQDYSNFHLKLNGHDVRVDHRCHKERGIDMEPQPKMGKNVLELEKRLQKIEGNENRVPITDRSKIFHDTQLRNLYRIMRHPEVVFEIASKHHSTFMWADVQKILHRYVEEAPLFQRLESKLKNSSELMLLKPDSDSQSIYTTRSLLKTEKSLVETAESLAYAKSHQVEERQVVQSLMHANKALEEFGGLSQDQIKAIYHMTDHGQLRCVVGIAGAGKTTALGVCQDIWKTEGYAVYGLAPTGKAAQNLEQSGISSMTLHKFLKSFEEGRCQYNSNSVLVLDEAGMVDIERFEKLLDAVQQLGVKLVVVGDGAQFQPVEAGPAFRLVTQRLGKAELNTVLRQNEEWQRDATVLFGRQETREAMQIYMDRGHVHIIEEKLPSLPNEAQSPQGIDKRQRTKEALIQAWHTDFKEGPEKQFLILAHSNRDVNALNESTRALLKESGYIAKEDFIYTVAKMAENDFGDKQTLKENKSFSKGDRIVFTRNNYGLGVKNGTMGTIIGLDKQTIQIKLDGEENKEISFAPNLNPYFNQGWAVTIHKSQGTTVDQTYVLASYEMTQNLAYVAMTRHRENVHVFGSNLDFWRPEKLPEALSKSGEKLSAADYLDTDSLNKLMQKEDHLLTKIFERISNELDAMGAVSKKAFWQVADYFLGANQDKEIRINADFSKAGIREEVRAEAVLKTKQEPRVSLVSSNPHLENPAVAEKKPSHARLKIPQEKENSLQTELQASEISRESNFTKLVRQCEERLHDILEHHNLPLTSGRANRILIQAERTAAFLLHAYGDISILPPEHEVVNFSLRAKYELNRIPEIQKDLMDEGETNAYRAYSIANRLASIEGRLYFEALQKGGEPLHPSFDARREFDKNQAQGPQLAAELIRTHYISDKVALQCARDLLHYRETHGEDPSTNQLDKMIQVAKQLEHKEYKNRFYDCDSGEKNFLCNRERELLFHHGPSYDGSRDLDQFKAQINKSLEHIQRQMERDREHPKQMDLSL